MTATIALVLATLSSGAVGEPVPTRAGIVDGVTQADGTRAWLGIPYAAPPVGALRWKPPRPALPWRTTYAAKQFAPSCMQPLRDHGIAYYVGDDPVAEDCLYLNVWAPPAARSGSRLPVIVFIHGGSFVAGSARKPLYVGDRLAAKGAIVVGINYRLGALGFLVHSALTAESPDHASGNYGLLDQIAALRWVRDNITAFGGDPGRVTIMGQSAGAISIALLQTSPLAQGLFHRIVALSGSPYSSPASDRTPTLSIDEAQGDTFRRSLGVADLAAMRRLPADRIVAAQGPAAFPIIDGLAIPSPPGEVYAAGRQMDVPILLGVTADEALGPLGTLATLADYRAATARLFGNRADEVSRLYPANNDYDAASAARALAHDSGFSTMMRSWAMMQTAHGRSPVYAYTFERRHPYTPGVAFSDLDSATAAVNHTDDVPYWLGTFDSLNGPRRTRDWTAADHALGDRMQAAIIAFAATGNPNTPALGLSWPRYDPEREETIAFGEGVRLRAWPNRARMDRLAAMGIPDPGTAKEGRK